jgi:hypothetical protein
MNIKGKLIQLLDLQTGIGKNGQWRKQDIILEIEGVYPKKLCVSVWGDKIDEKQLIIGNELDVSIDLESREFNGKWYTDLKAWKIVSKEEQITNSIITSNNENVEELNNDDSDFDLPF